MRFTAIIFASLLLAGCSSTPRTIIVNDSQSLVMDPSVLTAGVIADRPSIEDAQGRQRAYARVSNDRDRAVTLHYRFYWYDSQGLDVLPFPDSRTVIIPAGGSASLESINGNLEAKRVRLYLFL